MMERLRRFLPVALLVAGCLWIVLMALNPSGVESHVFFEGGRDLFGDFRMPRICAEFGYANDRQPLHDSCYPALGSCLVHLFSMDAGVWFTGVGLAAWIGAFLLFCRFRGWVLLLPAVLTSSILLHTCERGNPILFAAAGCLLYLAWYDDARPWRRFVAGLGLAVAVALKITPAVLGLLSVLRIREDCVRRREVVVDLSVMAGATIVLFVVPFVWYGGWDGFCQWWSNAAANAAHYAHTGAWGLLAVGRTVRTALHVDVTQPWPGMALERCVDSLLGLVCLGGAMVCSWRRMGTKGEIMLLVVAGMLLIPGNMHFYAGIYLIPVFALRLHEEMDWFEGACWFAMLCPLQIPFGAGCLNHPLANLAFLALLGMNLLRQGKNMKLKAVR